MPSAPRITSATISPTTFNAGDTLTAVIVSTGDPMGGEVYQWRLGDEPIRGQTGMSYIAATAETNINCLVHIDNGEGTATAVCLPPTVGTALVAPIISSVTFAQPVVGTATTASVVWTGVPSVGTITYQWEVDGVAVSGATSASYTPLTAQAASDLTVVATVTSTAGSASLESDAAEIYSVPVNTVAPVVIGSTVIGATLTCSEGTWTGYPEPSFTYQWFSNSAAIDGAVTTTFNTSGRAAGEVIFCRVTASSLAGTVEADSNTATLTSGGNQPVLPFTLPHSL